MTPSEINNNFSPTRQIPVIQEGLDCWRPPQAVRPEDQVCGNDEFDTPIHAGGDGLTREQRMIVRDSFRALDGRPPDYGAARRLLGDLVTQLGPDVPYGVTRRLLLGHIRACLSGTSLYSASREQLRNALPSLQAASDLATANPDNASAHERGCRISDLAFAQVQLGRTSTDATEREQLYTAGQANYLRGIMLLEGENTDASRNVLALALNNYVFALQELQRTNPTQARALEIQRRIAQARNLRGGGG